MSPNAAREEQVEKASPEYNLSHGENQLERGLKSRHIQFLALGTHLLQYFFQTDDFQAEQSARVSL